MARNNEYSPIESILENLFHVLPMIHKKLLSMNLDGVAGELSRQHLAIMGMLKDESLAVSEVAKRLIVPKSQMTHLIDYLVERNLVDRQPDATDRRVINISVTDHGKDVFQKCQSMVKKAIREKLSLLTPDELAEMAAALEKLSTIGAKLE